MRLATMLRRHLDGSPHSRPIWFIAAANCTEVISQRGNYKKGSDRGSH